MLNLKTFLEDNGIDLDKFKKFVKENKSQPCLCKDDSNCWLIAGVDWTEAEANGFETFKTWNKLDDEWRVLCDEIDCDEEIVWGFEEIF